MQDLFNKITQKYSPLNEYVDRFYGHYIYPYLEGDFGPVMRFNNKKMIVWSTNDYLGIGGYDIVKKYDIECAKKYGFTIPMGSRLLTGNTPSHETLEKTLAHFIKKPSVQLLNYGYQGIMSVIHALLDRHDHLIYDSLCHACIIDARMMTKAKVDMYRHNDINHLKTILEKITQSNNKQGSILVVTEGVFGMTGDTAHLSDIIALKKEYPFRLLVDDAHGIGIMGPNGCGTGAAMSCHDGIDVYVATFAKAFACIGAFVASESSVIQYLKATNRSQIFARSLPRAIVESIGFRVKLSLENPQWQHHAHHISTQLYHGLKDMGYKVGNKNNSVIIPIIVDSDKETMTLIDELRENGIFASGVTFPVVPQNTHLIRLIPTAAHTETHLEYTLNTFHKLKKSIL